MLELFEKTVAFRRKRVVRIIVTYRPEGDSVGTGFFIDAEGDLLTCFHVVFGKELRNMRNDSVFQAITGQDEHTRLEQYIQQRISKIEIEPFNGLREEVEIKKFDERYDVVLLTTKVKNNHSWFRLNLETRTDYGDEVEFGGFPMAVGYRGDQVPFAVTKGIISTFLNTQVGGENYEHIQINGVNLEGNSGAPLFLKDSKKVLGIINGNMIRGFQGRFMGVNGQPFDLSFAIPLGITYATSLNTIMQNTEILNEI